jgi:hypothetical protein
MSGQTIEKVYGRDILALFRKDGKVLLPSSITQVFSKILYELKTNKVIDTQVTQHNFDKIDVKIVIDNKLKNIGPSTDQILSLIKREFKKKMGQDLKISLKEVKKINRKSARIISKIEKNKYKITGYM